MKTHLATLDYKTKSGLQFLDISDEVAGAVQKSGIKNGLVNVQTLHTTASLLLNENEPLLLEDLSLHLEETSSRRKEYRHNNLTVRTVNMCDDECANGHAHVQAAHLCATLTLNVVNGKMQLGQWQRILFVELDRARHRKLQVMVLGE